jgi:ribosomal protein S18 acetylase RimI-like enzyme
MLYHLPLPAPLTVLTKHPTGGSLRYPDPAETEPLADLMLDAYRSSQDCAGESTDDALVEVEGFCAGREGEPLLTCSWVYENNGALLSACLVRLDKGVPFVANVLTMSPWKGRGLGSFLLRQSLLSLQDAHYEEVRAEIAQSNRRTQALFMRFGFIAV